MYESFLYFLEEWELVYIFFFLGRFELRYNIYKSIEVIVLKVSYVKGYIVYIRIVSSISFRLGFFGDKVNN